ncbi:MAG TPA: serine/threonine-protein kinase, partial [Kofleriaceae bacterium]|nr:serine/threonine-protein kinase [Kofleriaceae bacterium]
ARAMARLRHRNVLSVYEVGEHGGRVYIAMEQMDGGTLRDEVARRRGAGGASWREVVALYAEAGRGLIAAHEAGMVHRDFKPDNVLVDRDGRVVVADFGLVGDVGRRGAGHGEARDGSVDSILTRESIALGTPAYMAPEQHAGAAAVDARADVFSFCVSLYEALHGERPFRGERRQAYLAAVATGDIRPAPADSKVPAWLREVLVRGMSADPDRRYGSMAEVLSELGFDPATERRPGALLRLVGAVVCGLFLLGWGLAAFWLDPELSYRAHYIGDLAFLGGLVLLGLLARQPLQRSAFNRRVLGLAAAAGVGVALMTAGADLMDLPALTVGILHMFLIGFAALVAAVLIDRLTAVIGAAYLAAFFVAAARPELYFAASLPAHVVLLVGGFAIMRARA